MCNYLLLVGKYYIIKSNCEHKLAKLNLIYGEDEVKKFAKFLICLCLCFSFMLTGCSLVQRNTDRYLNRVVATAGETIEITKEELINAYNNYGYQYNQYYGYTVEKAMSMTIDNLINNKILIERAKKHIVVDETTNEVYYLTFDDEGNEIDRRLIYNKNVWQNDILEETYKSINEQIATFEKTVRKELNLEDEEFEEEEETKSDYPAQEVYEKKVELENGKFSPVVKDIEPAEDLMGDFIQADTGNKQVSEIAYKRYIKSLIYSEKGEGKSTNEQEVFQREVDRIYKIHEENKYITELQNQYTQTYTITDDLNSQIVDYYKKQVKASYEKYAELGDKGYEQYCKDMQQDSSKVYYHSYGAKFVQVSHVLIKLSDVQLAEIAELDKKLSTGVITQKERDDEYQKVLNKTVVHVRDEDGNETEQTKTVQEVYDEINNELSKYDTVEEKAVAFNKFIYKYNQDEGIINKETYYVVNLDTNIEDTMVKEFADMSRELSAQNSEGGNIGKQVFVSSDNYSGYHIIFNAGVVESDLSIDQVNALTSDYAKVLFNKKLMLGADKTYYDYIYDEIVTDNYSSYQNSITNTERHNMKIVIYVDRIKDLY